MSATAKPYCEKKKICVGEYKQNIYDLKELLLLSKNKIRDLSRRDISELKAGRDCGPNRLKATEKLHTYNSILARHIARLAKGDKLCLCPDDLQYLTEKIISIVGKNCRIICSDIDIDNSQEEIWVFKNPTCRSYKEWEKWVKFYCGELDLKISSEEQACDLIFEISKEIINCDTLFAISTYKEACDLNLKVNRSEEENILDFQLLHEELPSCDLDLKTYQILVENNISFDIIKTVYESDLSLVIENGKPLLAAKLNKYPLNELSSDIRYLEKLGIRPNVSKNKLLSDYK